MDEEIITKNPFIGFKIPTPRQKSNVALTAKEFEAFKIVPVKTKQQEIIRDMAIFRYYCLGMRIKDQLLLTRENLKEGRLIYTTSKTAKHFDFKLPKECIKILKKWEGQKLLFPFLRSCEETKTARRRYNNGLKRIARYAGITKTMSSHVFRHTYASLNDHLTDEQMQTALAHENIKTTRGYRQTIKNQDHLIKQTKK